MGEELDILSCAFGSWHSPRSNWFAAMSDKSDGTNVVKPEEVLQHVVDGDWDILKSDVLLGYARRLAEQRAFLNALNAIKNDHDAGQRYMNSETLDLWQKMHRETTEALYRSETQHTKAQRVFLLDKY